MFIVGSWMKDLGVKNGDDLPIFGKLGLKTKQYKWNGNAMDRNATHKDIGTVNGKNFIRKSDGGQLRQ